MLEVQVARIVLYFDSYIVLLQSQNDARVLPINIDRGQAESIQLQLEGVAIPRPLTHDLMRSIIAELGGRLVRVEVCDLVEGTFYARLIVEREGRPIEIDARPSDAIALALRASAPIFVDDEVMNQAGATFDGDDAGEAQRKLSPSEQLEQKLKKAIAEERYEDAAALRDELKKDRENKPSN